MLHVELRRSEELTAQDRDQLGDLFSQVWGAPVNAGRTTVGAITWAVGAPWAVLVRDDDGDMVCHVGILERTILVGGCPFRVGGIARVATFPEWRRRGAATLAMRKAAEFMRHELDVDFGLLFPSRMAAPLYARLGWRAVKGPL